MKLRSTVVLLCLLAATAGCRRRADPAEGEQAVRAYLARLVEAYRASDVAIVDPVVGEEQGRKLLGLIGVKRDAGVTLDAQLLDIQFDRVEARGGKLLVVTREAWHYADRRIGTGEQVGEDSTDRYRLRYTLARRDRGWIVERIEFLDPPEVGRTAAPLPVGVRALHGLPPRKGGAPKAGSKRAAAPAKTAAPAGKAP